MASKTAESYREAKAPKTRKGRKKLEHTHIDHLDNDGHVVEHHYTRKTEAPDVIPSHESEKHAFTSTGEMMAHLNKKFGGTSSKTQPAKSDAEEEAEDQAGEAPGEDESQEEA